MCCNITVLSPQGNPAKTLKIYWKRQEASSSKLKFSFVSFWSWGFCSFWAWNCKIKPLLENFLEIVFRRNNRPWSCILYLRHTHVLCSSFQIKVRKLLWWTKTCFAIRVQRIISKGATRFNVGNQKSFENTSNKLNVSQPNRKKEWDLLTRVWRNSCWILSGLSSTYPKTLGIEINMKAAKKTMTRSPCISTIGSLIARWLSWRLS